MAETSSPLQVCCWKVYLPASLTQTPLPVWAYPGLAPTVMGLKSHKCEQSLTQVEGCRALCILVDKLNRLGFKPLTIKMVFKVLNHSGNSLQFSQHLSLSFRCPTWKKSQTHLTDISFICNISALLLISFLIHSWLIFVPLATDLCWEFMFEWFSAVMPYFYSNRVFLNTLRISVLQPEQCLDIRIRWITWYFDLR